MLGTALLGVITLRLHAVSRGERPRFAPKSLAVLQALADGADRHDSRALGFLPLLISAWVSVLNNVLPTVALLVVAVPLLWPTALFVVALPAFWCDGSGRSRRSRAPCAYRAGDPGAWSERCWRRSA